MAEPRRIPPHDLAAERAVLGGILIDNTALERVNLAPEDFFYRGHKQIFRAMQHIAALGTAIDRLTLSDALKKEPGHPPAVYLAGLANATPSAANIVDPAKIVREHADRRRLINLLEDGLQRAYTGEAVAPLRERLLQGVGNLADQRPDGFKSTSWAELKRTSQESSGLGGRRAAPAGRALLSLCRAQSGEILDRPDADASSGARVAVARSRRTAGWSRLFGAGRNAGGCARAFSLRWTCQQRPPVAIVFEREPEATFKKLEQLIDTVTTQPGYCGHVDSTRPNRGHQRLRAHRPGAATAPRPDPTEQRACSLSAPCPKERRFTRGGGTGESGAEWDR